MIHTKIGWNNAPYAPVLYSLVAVNDKTSQLTYRVEGPAPSGFSNPWYISEQMVQTYIQKGLAVVPPSGLEMEEGF